MRMDTQHAPAERASSETIERQAKSILDIEYLQELYAAVSDIVLIINKERQIIMCNDNLLNALGFENGDSIVGLRVGEAFNCCHAFESEGGCGTTEFCKECGAVNAMLACQKGNKDVQECRMIKKDGDALDFRVQVTPLTLEGENFTIVSLKDISHEKRRRLLERMFFHDIINTAVGVRGLSELLITADEDQLEEFRTMIYSAAAKLVDEIKSQKDLAAAENNELVLNLVELDSMEFLKSVQDLYQNHEVAKDLNVVIDRNSQKLSFSTDYALLSRIIGNMTKNALEASLPGQTVTLGCEKENDNIKFWVNNPTFMPKKIQRQIFQRSFSTKGADRGIGTYSMKLISERYLNGRIFFSSSEEKGTIFTACYPLTNDRKKK